MKKFVLLVAGGSGNRMKSEIPKQFLVYNNLPVLMHTFKQFLKFDSEIHFILVIPENQAQKWTDLCVKYEFNTKHKVVFGGKTRFDSVKNGLDGIRDEGIVFIHDGVRPLVSVETIQRCYQTTTEKGNALPVLPVSESLRIVDDKTNIALDRTKYYTVQTPQTFKIEVIKKAYKQIFSDSFTDDASVAEADGEIINLVAGNRENIKITFSEDLLIASILSQIIG